MKRRQPRSTKPSPLLQSAKATLGKVAKPVKKAGVAVMKGYLGATNKLADKIISKLPPTTKKSTRSRRK